MNRTVKKKHPLLFCLLAALCFYAACTRNPEPKKDAATGSGTSVESAAKANKDASATATGSAKPPAATLAAEPLMTEEVLAVFEKSCKQCHGPDGHGITAVAPDLRLSPQRSKEEWEMYLRDPQNVVPGTKKQPMRGLSDEDVKAVAEYLYDLTQHNPPPQK